MTKGAVNINLEPGLAPPPSYYRDNCTVAFEFVFQQYAHMLPLFILSQLDAYSKSSSDAQRLFARLLTRKGPFFRIDSLDYDEVEDKHGAIGELCDTKLIMNAAVGPADQLLGLVTKKEIIGLWPKLNHRDRKDELVRSILNQYSDQQIALKLWHGFPYIRVYDEAALRLIKLLYFGNGMQSWSEFVIRDLGISRYESPARLCKQFETPVELSLYLAMLEQESYSYRLNEFPELADWLIVSLSIKTSNLVSERKRIRALNRIGKWCEQKGSLVLALQAYGFVEQHPARERMVRINHKLDNHESRDNLLGAIRQDPYCEEEQQFAERFGQRNAGYLPPTSSMEIEAVEGTIEQTVLRVLTESGGWGLHCENALLRSLTGLAYWEAIYAPVPGAFSNPFQGSPHDLNEPDFSAVRSTQIEQCEKKMACDESLKSHLTNMWLSKRGTSTNMVSWSLFQKIPIEHYIEGIGPEVLRKLMAYFIRHIYSRSKGFPDLFVSYEGGGYEFVEVKGPGDQLSLSQRVWLKKLESMAVSARVIKVKVLH